MRAIDIEAEARAERAHRAGTMADAGLLVRRRSRERAAELVGDEDRVVAEAAACRRLARRSRPSHDALGGDGAPVGPRQRHDAAKAGSPIGARRRSAVEEPSRSARASDRAEARRAHARARPPSARPRDPNRRPAPAARSPAATARAFSDGVVDVRRAVSSGQHHVRDVGERAAPRPLPTRATSARSSATLPGFAVARTSRRGITSRPAAARPPRAASGAGASSAARCPARPRATSCARAARSREGLALRRPLHLDEAARAGHDEVHVDGRRGGPPRRAGRAAPARRRSRRSPRRRCP